MPLETIKVRFNVDFSNQTIIEGIKSLLVGILQRGYLSKTPPYKRELTVTKGL